jgi:hypothetical protein
VHLTGFAGTSEQSNGDVLEFVSTWVRGFKSLVGVFTISILSRRMTGMTLFLFILEDLFGKVRLKRCLVNIYHSSKLFTPIYAKFNFRDVYKRKPETPKT